MNELTNFYEKIPVTKTGQKHLSCMMKDNLLNGEISPLEAIVKAKSLNDIISSFLKDDEVKDCIINECEKYGRGETPSFSGATVRVRETGVKMDYSVCNDPVYNHMAEQMEYLKEQMRQREKELRVITTKRTEVNEDNGEVYTIYPPARTASTSYIITFSK